MTGKLTMELIYHFHSKPDCALITSGPKIEGSGVEAEGHLRNSTTEHSLEPGASSLVGKQISWHLCNLETGTLPTCRVREQRQPVRVHERGSQCQGHTSSQEQVDWILTLQPHTTFHH